MQCEGRNDRPPQCGLARSAFNQTPRPGSLTYRRSQAKPAEAGVVANIPELDELFERWMKERQPAPNSKNEYERAKNLFKTLNEDKAISEYTNADARKFKDAIVVKTDPNGNR